MEFAVEVTRSGIVRPSSSSSPDGEKKLVRLTVFDLVTYNAHIPILYVFRSPMPSNDSLVESLRRVLSHYPHLAGTFATAADGRRCIDLDDHGVYVVETKVCTPLHNHLPLSPSTANLLPSLPTATELLQVQLNRFSCGGVVLGITFHHRVADGASIGHFLTTWANLSAGRPAAPLPYHDRASVCLPRSPPTPLFPHDEVEFKKSAPDSSSAAVAAGVPAAPATVRAHFSEAFLVKLKAKASSATRRCSTFACVLAHVWKIATVARGIDGEEITRVRTTVNGRQRVRPPAPVEYFGNFVLLAFPTMKVADLLDASYGEVVDVIQSAVAAVDDGYFKSFIDFGELMRRGVAGGEVVETVPELGGSLSPDLEFTSWLGLGLDGVDFGGGRPLACVSPSLPTEGLGLLAPSMGEDGGVDVYLSLMQEHADVFERLCRSLD